MRRRIRRSVERLCSYDPLVLEMILGCVIAVVLILLMILGGALS